MQLPLRPEGRGLPHRGSHSQHPELTLLPLWQLHWLLGSQCIFPAESQAELGRSARWMISKMEFLFGVAAFMVPGFWANTWLCWAALPPWQCSKRIIRVPHKAPWHHTGWPSCRGPCLDAPISSWNLALPKFIVLGESLGESSGPSWDTGKASYWVSGNPSLP